MLAQRLKAVGLAAKDKNWDRAKFLELIPSQLQTLISSEEAAVMRAEKKEEVVEAAADYAARSGKWEDNYSPKGGGKGHWLKVQWDAFQKANTKNGGKKGGKGGKKGGKGGKKGGKGKRWY